MKYTLKKPIVLSEVNTVSEFTFREEPCSGDLRGIKFSSLADLPVDDVMKIGGRLCAQPDVVMTRLSMADTIGVTNIVMGFLNAGLETGTAP